jgi:hypothetical protein
LTILVSSIGRSPGTEGRHQRCLRRFAFAALIGAAAFAPRAETAHAAEPTNATQPTHAAQPAAPSAAALAAATPVIPAPPAPGPATGLADSAGLRATVFGTPPQDMAPMPSRVPLDGNQLTCRGRGRYRRCSGSIANCACGFPHRTSPRRWPSSFRHGQRRQHHKIIGAARGALRSRLSRADHAVADISRDSSCRPRAPESPVISPRMVTICTRHATDHRTPAAQGADHRHRRARLQSRRRQCSHREIDRCGGGQAAHPSRTS